MAAVAALRMACAAVAVIAGGAWAAQDRDWPVYHGDAAGQHYSALTQIDRANVGTLEWSTTVEVPLGEPILVGAATITDSGDQSANADDSKRPQLGLVVEVRRAEN